MRCVAVCDLETSWMRRPWLGLGRRATITKNISLFHKASCWCIKHCEVYCYYNCILLLSLQNSWLLLEWSCLGLKLVKPTVHYMYSTTSLIFNNCTLCPHCTFGFRIYLRTNSAFCHLQHKLIGFNNRDEKCLLRGTDRGFK